MSKVKIIIALLAAALLLSACSAGGIYDLMSPPKLSDDFQRVCDVLDVDVANGYHLIYTIRGNDTSAVRFIDLSGDGMKEAVAFYKRSGAADEVSVHVMSQEYGNWQTIADVSMAGIDIDKVSFCDFDGDSRLELVIGRRTADVAGNILSIFSFYVETKEIYTSEYVDFLTSDVDGNGRQELFFIASSTDKKGVEGRIIGNDGNGYRMLSSVKMDSSVTSYRYIKTGNYSTGKIGIFVDGLKGTSIGVTELLIYENGALKNPFGSLSSSLNVAAKQFSIISRDINSDGIVEIATVHRFPGNADIPLPDAVWNIRWNVYSDNSLESKVEMMYNSYFDYAIILPKKLEGLVGAEMRDNGEIIKIYPIGDKDTTICTIITGLRTNMGTEENGNREIFAKDDKVIELQIAALPDNYKQLELTDGDIAEIKIFYALSQQVS